MQLAYPVTRLSGRSINSPVVNSSNQGQPVLRTFTAPSQPNTADQQSIRSIFSLVTKQWKLLTEAQRTDWNAWAELNPVTNRLGRKVDRNGVSAYLQLASIHYIDTGVLLSAAPTLGRPAPATGLENLLVGTDLITVEVAHGYTTLTGLKLMVRQTAQIPYESQHPAPSYYRLVKGVSTESIVPLAVSNASYLFEGPRFVPVDGGLMGIEVSIVNGQGYESQEFRKILDVGAV
jgi:hypothetical protein